MTDPDNNNCNLIWLDTVDSTNTYAINNFDSLDDQTFVLAREQTAGKGRRGRQWQSPADTNIYGSLIIKRSSQRPHEMVWPGSLAALELLRSYGPELDFWLKWPNDIFCKNRKIAGVLCEGKLGLNNQLEGIVFGIGINLNMDEEALNAIDKPATSLFYELKEQVNLKKFAFELGIKATSLYSIAFSVGFDNFFRLWKEENRLIGQQVKVETDKFEVIEGCVVDINSDAELVLLTNEGNTYQFNSGEVTIKEGTHLC